MTQCLKASGLPSASDNLSRDLLQADWISYWLLRPRQIRSRMAVRGGVLQRAGAYAFMAGLCRTHCASFLAAANKLAVHGGKGRPAEEYWRSPAYCGVNARSS